MLGLTSTAPLRPDHTACSGCSLCLLVCPVWHANHDLLLTPHGRAKALQHGAHATDIAASVESCTLCAACEPVCPEEIDLVGMIMSLRTQLPRTAALLEIENRIGNEPERVIAARSAPRNLLLPGMALRAHTRTMMRAQALLDSSSCDDDGEDIALALEAGVMVPRQRQTQFLAPLKASRKVVVANGLLLRHLKSWLPNAHVVSLGEALSGLAAVRRKLCATDLYVIESRAYHADYRRLVRHYDLLRTISGCATNLDLQRIAIPATARSLPQRLGLVAPDDLAQAHWILYARRIRRIVVESMEDLVAFRAASDYPVVHLADLADD